MPLYSQTADVPEYTELTWKLRRGYVGFRPDYQKDIITWLMVVADKYHTQREGVRRSSVSKTTPYYVAMMNRYNVALGLIQELIDMATDKWDSASWTRAEAAIEKSLNALADADPTTALRGAGIHAAQQME